MSTEERLLRLENAFATLVEIQRGLEERFDTHDKWINELGAAQVRLTEAQTQTQTALSQLAEKQAETEERLNNLITLFERHISENHKAT